LKYQHKNPNLVWSVVWLKEVHSHTLPQEGFILSQTYYTHM